MRFLITDRPDNNLDEYIQRLREANVTDLVRACKVSYPSQPFEGAGITLHSFDIPDGGAPAPQVLKQWLALVHRRADTTPPGATIAVHCAAGLGRAPVLVAVALIELEMSSLDAMAFVRSHRKGAFNSTQIAFLES
jgi:protein tyrosine phosphatase type 4A